MDEPHMVTQPEAAEILGISIATLRRRIADGTLALPKPDLGPYLKRPRRIAYERAVVENIRLAYIERMAQRTAK